MSNIGKYKVEVFGASVDPVEQNKAFHEKGSYNFVLLSDTDREFSKKLGVLNPANNFAYRWTYIIDEKGIIRSIDKSVKTTTHGKDLLARLEELGIPKK